MCVYVCVCVCVCVCVWVPVWQCELLWPHSCEEGCNWCVDLVLGLLGGEVCWGKVPCHDIITTPSIRSTIWLSLDKHLSLPLSYTINKFVVGGHVNIVTLHCAVTILDNIENNGINSREHCGNNIQKSNVIVNAFWWGRHSAETTGKNSQTTFHHRFSVKPYFLFIPAALSFNLRISWH